MNDELMITKINEALDNAKAKNIDILSVAELSTEFDTFIICTATSTTHAHSLMHYANEAAKELGIQAHMPRRSNDEWLILDCGNFVVHIMLERARDFYKLENLWRFNQSEE